MNWKRKRKKQKRGHEKWLFCHSRRWKFVCQTNKQINYALKHERAQTPHFIRVFVISTLFVLFLLKMPQAKPIPKRPSIPISVQHFHSNFSTKSNETKNKSFQLKVIFELLHLENIKNLYFSIVISLLFSWSDRTECRYRYHSEYHKLYIVTRFHLWNQVSTQHQTYLNPATIKQYFNCFHVFFFVYFSINGMELKHRIICCASSFNPFNESFFLFNRNFEMYVSGNI